MDNNNLILVVRKALKDWKDSGMSNHEFAEILNLKDETQDGRPHKKARLVGHIDYARNHQGRYQKGSLKHIQHLKIANYYLNQ